MLQLIHTADWHLGHSLHGLSRDYEHARFLTWLLDQLDAQQADALIIAGDVFDSANPPATAQALLYEFLRNAKQRRRDLDVVVIAGNHDSGSRLAAPAPILDAFGVHVVGGLPRREDRTIDWDRLCLPLTDAAGRIGAWCGAMPFLRAADLPAGADPNSDFDPDIDQDPLIGGVRHRYRELFGALRARAADGVPLIATGHCYMTGTRLSELSERRILGGNQHALPADIFTDDIAYAALGHLHLAQRVGRRDGVRYSGSPLPLAFAEAHYRHQVVAVAIDRNQVRVESLPVPRAVDILRLPADGPAGLDAVVAQLAALPLNQDLPPERYPLLEVRVLLDKPEPALRQRLDEVLADRPVRLLKVTTRYTGSNEALADAEVTAQLETMAPEDVFLRRYAQAHEQPPAAELLAAFSSLVESVTESD